MNKGNLLKIFEELLKEWESAEGLVIHDRGCLDDYNELEKEVEEYRRRFLEALDGVKE
ncbi:hypothetical protein ACTFSB_28515 [Bacillus cereus group sp. MYBK14-3]|uniref:hypothetical protein n=1 Tax=unclassified Bacillus cereus group TaxID=2750818 RepID=UPI003F7B12AD